MWHRGGRHMSCGSRCWATADPAESLSCLFVFFFSTHSYLFSFPLLLCPTFYSYFANFLCIQIQLKPFLPFHSLLLCTLTLALTKMSQSVSALWINFSLDSTSLRTFSLNHPSIYCQYPSFTGGCSESQARLDMSQSITSSH